MSHFTPVLPGTVNEGIVEEADKTRLLESHIERLEMALQNSLAMLLIPHDNYAQVNSRARPHVSYIKFLSAARGDGSESELSNYPPLFGLSRATHKLTPTCPDVLPLAVPPTQLIHHVAAAPHHELLSMSLQAHTSFAGVSPTHDHRRVRRESKHTRCKHNDLSASLKGLKAGDIGDGSILLGQLQQENS